MKYATLGAATAIAALLTGLTTPASATLQFAASVTVNAVTTTFFCADGQACDTNLAPNQLSLGTINVGGVLSNGSLETSNAVGQNILNSTNFSLINLNALPATIVAAVGDTNFTPPVTSFSASGSATYQNAVGGTLLMSFYNDPLGAQGADTATDTPGTQVAISPLFTSTIALNDSTSFNASGPISDLNPFSMTLAATITLPGSTAPGNQALSPQVVSRGQSLIKEIAVPEPGSLALLGTGLVIGGIAIRRRQNKNRMPGHGFSAA